ncbi:hypothetical protein Tco_1489859, partial [Tanacetum coccineum]
MKSVRSSSHVSIVPSLNSEEFVNVFMRIGFGSSIKLVSFDKSQVVTFDSKSLAVSGIVIAEPGVGATTWSTAYMGSSSIGVRSGSSNGSTSSELEARVCIQERNCLGQFARKL